MSSLSDEEFRTQIVERLPKLRAFARSIVGDPAKADDLVQNAIVRALTNADSFGAGTNLTAWLFTILRNNFYSEVRKFRQEVEDADGVHAARLVTKPGQMAKLEFRDFQSALATLPLEQREALVLIGGSGLAYEEAATICGCAVGTIKSRVNRARARLKELINPDEPTPLDVDGDCRQRGENVIKIAGVRG